MLKKLLMIAAIVATMLLSACGVSVEDSGSGKDRDEKQPKATQEVKQDNDDKQSGKNNDPGTDVNPGNSDDGGNNNGDNGNGNTDNGNGYDGGNNGQDDPYQGDNGNNNGNNNGNDEFAGAKAEIMLYKLDDNTLVVNVTGPMCTKVKEQPNGDRGESEFYLTVNEGETRMEMLSDGFHGWSGKDDNTLYFSANVDYNGIVVIGEEQFYCVVKEDGLWNRIKLNGDYELKYGRTYAAEYEGFTVASGNVADIVSTIDEDANAAMFAEAISGVKVAEPADPVWNGGYLMGYSWEGKVGFVEVEVLDGGLLRFHVKTDEKERVYYAKQTEYDKAEYSYGSYIKATAEAILLGSYNKHAKFELRTDPDKATELHTEISEYDNESNSRDFYLTEDFQLFTAWHTLPADYSDKDPFDLIGLVDVSSNSYLKPATDNYVIAVRDKYTTYITDDQSVNCVYVMLTSYDDNNFMVQKVESYIFENEADAKAYHNRVSKWYTSENPYKISGSSIYYTYEPSSIYYSFKRNTVQNFVDYESLYYDCHYLYKDSEYYGKCTVYMNKPLDSGESKVGLADAMRWKKIYGKSYHSKDLKGVELRCSIDNYGFSVSIEGKTGLDKYRFESMNNVRLDGAKVVGMATDYTYDYKTDKYLYQVIFRTLEFTDTEAVVSDYFFDVDDITNHGITFDNFKDKQAAQVISQTFDLTRTAD